MWPFDHNNQSMYQQYAQAYDTGNFAGFDPSQAFGHIQRFMQGAPYDLQQQVYQQHFEQMPYDQRMLLMQRVPPQYAMDMNNPASMAQSFALIGQQQPGLLHQIFNHPILLASGVALTGLIAKHMIAHHEREMMGHQPQYNAGIQQGAMGQQYGYNNQNYGQMQYMQQEINKERLQEQELRRELKEEEREIERLEERREHRHHRREDYY